MTLTLAPPSSLSVQQQDAFGDILTPAALDFLHQLQQKFGARREELLQLRTRRQAEFDAGKLPDFLPETAALRAAEWRVASIPADLMDRRVEITGPVDRKMIINGLNSGARVYMADFEDSSTPTWANLIEGQINLRDAINRRIAFTSPSGKQYALGEKLATLMVRPRGWRLPEKHALLDGKPISGALFDFGLFFFHNAKALIEKGSGPYFYLPKLQSHLEARLWNDVFNFAQDSLNIPRGSIRATVLIETLPAAFEMDEILYELREHSAGLNCGRWDYLFSCIKTMKRHGDFVLADRGQLTMVSPFMRAYTELLVKTCHRRNAFAMGGMAAQIPIKNDPATNDIAMNKVRADKEREANDGFDGTWVAHPGLIAIAQAAFDQAMPTPNQIHNKRAEVRVRAADMLNFQPQTPITLAGLKLNIDIGLQYLGSWLAGVGCVPIHNLMEDAATAEISRAQLWHWIRSPKGVLEDGRKVSVELFRELLPEVMAEIQQDLGEAQYAKGKYALAAELFEKLTVQDELAEFLTLPGYDYLV